MASEPNGENKGHQGQCEKDTKRIKNHEMRLGIHPPRESPLFGGAVNSEGREPRRNGQWFVRVAGAEERCLSCVEQGHKDKTTLYIIHLLLH